MLMALAVSLLAILSVAMLKDPLRGYLWNSTFTGFAELLPLTSWTAVRVWIFWAVASAILALTLRRIDPRLELFDAFIGGAAGTWIFAYLAGNLLGPIGLFRPLTIWLMAICAAVWLWRHHSNIALSSPSAGQKLALLACVLMTIGALPLQLGSPIPPVMDVLNIPAAAQRVVTFNRYLPFDNDPYGYWTPLARVPALDLFYAMLTIGSFTKLASVAEMAALVPMSCLMIFATYRLGRAVIGDVGGGIASILLFASTILTRTQSMRGTAVALALVAVGLGFFTDPDRRPIKTAVGTLALATAVASHAIIGGLAMATAGFVTLFDLFADDLAGALVEACCLFGGLMIAFPEFSIALNLELPYPILPASELIGLAVISYTASRLGRRPSYETLFVKCVTASLFLALLWLLLWSPHSMFMLDELHNSFPGVARVIGVRTCRGAFVMEPADNCNLGHRYSIAYRVSGGIRICTSMVAVHWRGRIIWLDRRRSQDRRVLVSVLPGFPRCRSIRLGLSAVVEVAFGRGAVSVRHVAAGCAARQGPRIRRTWARL